MIINVEQFKSKLQKEAGMSRISQILSCGCAVFVAFTLTMCGPKPPAKGYADSVPDEMERLVKKSYSQSVYAVGTATGPTEAIATEKATMDARAEIARQFKSQIDALQKSYEETVNDKAVEEYSQVQEIFATLEVSGSKAAKTMVRPEKKGTFSAKVLVVVSAEQLKSMLDEKMQMYTSFRASKAYEELEKRVAREKEQESQE